MIATRKILLAGAGLIAGASAMAVIADAVLWAHVRVPSGFYLLPPPALAVSVADGRSLRPGRAGESWPRDGVRP